MMINISVLFSKLSLRKRIKNRLSIKLLLLAACLLLLTSCDAATNHPVTDSNHLDDNKISDIKESIVHTAFELHLNQYGVCRADIRLPNLNHDLPNADEMNEFINSEFRYILNMKDINDCQSSEGFDYVWYKYDYTVADFDGIYSIAVYSTITSSYGSYSPLNYVQSFYYDMNNGEILTIKQFLDKIGYSEEDIVNAYINSCCPAYTPNQIDFSQIFFYFDEHKDLNFFFNLSSIIQS